MTQSHTTSSALDQTYPRTSPTALLQPVMTPEQMRIMRQQYAEFKQKILETSDYQQIKTKKGPRCFLKKSGFRKLAIAFSISTDIVHEVRRDLGNHFVYETTCRAFAPNGRFATACAGCASTERDFAHKDNDVRAISQTRAVNRAIADLLGEDVSAEEMSTPPFPAPTASPVRKGTAPVSASEERRPQHQPAEKLDGYQLSYLTWFIRKFVADPAEQEKALARVKKMSKAEARLAVEQAAAMRSQIKPTPNN